MPLTFAPNFVEGKVYRSRKKNDEDDESHALKELQTILAAKNRRICDCEAQLHDLLENCLSCGRLTCEAEGQGKCFNCGSIILSQDRRRILQKYIDITPSGSVGGYGNDNTRSSNIIDNQFDQFAIDNKKHLREEDRRKMKENLEDLQAQRYKRKLVLNVDLDNLSAGASSELVIEDYQKALKDLQLRDQHHSQARYNLHELVSRESKKTYNFQYNVPGEPKKKKGDSDGTERELTSSRVGNRSTTKQKQQSRGREVQDKTIVQ